MTDSLGPVAGPPQRDLDRDLAARLGRPDPDRRAVPGEDDRVRPDVADRPPGEQQVVELVERRPALGHDLEPAAIEAEVVEALDEQAAGDALEVEVGDAVVAHALGRVRRDGEDLEAGLRREDAERRLARSRARRPPRSEFAAISRAVAPSSSRLTPTIAAERRDRSRSRARAGRPRRARPCEASPTGSVCLTMATVGAV